MLRNYFKIAWRNLRKEKTFSILNIAGLSFAFGISILLGATALFHLSYDRFHTHKDSLYGMYTQNQTPKGPKAGTTYPVPFAVALVKEVPGIDKITRRLSDSHLAFYQDKELSMDAKWVDPDFMEMFTFNIIEGNRQNPLSDKFEAVISQTAAKNLLGNEKATGKTISLLLNGKKQPFTISAVVEDAPAESSLEFDLLLNFMSHPENIDTADEWGSSNHDVIVMLEKDISPGNFEKSTTAFTNLHYSKDIAGLKRDGAQPNNNGQYKQIRLYPFTDSHFIHFENGQAVASRKFPYMVLSIAFLILFIACVNFINMSIAKSSKRLREIGMRKTLGAEKVQLFFQFWGESMLIFGISLLCGIALSKILLEPFMTLFNTDVSFHFLFRPDILFMFILSAIFITLLAGGYPAVLLSRLGTLQALKGKLSANAGNRVRNILIVVQFGIAILLISSTLVLRSQLEFMRNKNLGFNKAQVLSFPLNGKKDSYQAVDLLRNKLKNNPGILEVTGADNNLGLGRDGSAYTSILGFDYQGRGIKTHMLVVDYNYIETLDIELVKGRSFNRKYATDSLGLVINEAMAKELGNEDILQSRIVLDDSVNYHVIGVMKDFNFKRLNEKIEPLTLFIHPEWDLYYAYVKVAPDNLSRSYETVKKAWAEIEPNAPFMGSFLDENIDRTFKREKTMIAIVSSGSVLAVILSCIGLFAISLIMVNQRTKEIGVRKVVGANAGTITFMLSKDFLRLVAISFLIAGPLAWWLMSQWLQNYQYRIDLNIWVFLAAGVLTALTALITISFKTLNAALQNPVKSLRTE
ncbi:FtsX-like permease family protein [Abyssalbus ytuae]|uniref:ABC transporter permease n=1 Tax=Abyssalbus ytuae TaxID=2926907 RepID=A0A9E6ZK86_9FLAO|nr:FtsX-like permease family protein [Abyssalbus ytuae]UOB16069.1 ABC transporter permease [Abyssalbus ytuae]